MKDYYTLKEIILGLRKEQLKIRKELLFLESKLNIDDKLYYESYLTIQRKTSLKKDVQLTLVLTKKNKMIEDILYAITFHYQHLKGRLNYNFNDLVKDNNGNYSLYDGKILKEDQTIFNETANKILNNKFVNEVINTYRFSGDSNYQNALNTTPTKTKYYGSRKDRINNLTYDARTDSLWVTNLYFDSYQEIIDDLLNIKVPKNIFSEYIQSIIEENSDVKKEIIIPKERNIKRISEFYLNEEKNEFILVKKK